MYELNPSFVISIFDQEVEAIARDIEQHHILGVLVGQTVNDNNREKILTGYIDFLKMTVAYVRFTEPMLRASGNFLIKGDEEDQLWGSSMLKYAEEEKGHDQWTLDDMEKIGASQEQIRAPFSELSNIYGKYFVDRASEHPYAILAAKGVLEHLSISQADKVVAGLMNSGIPNVKEALSFLASHGKLDIEHVRDGDERLKQLTDKNKLEQVLEAAYFTGGMYRSFLREI